MSVMREPRQMTETHGHGGIIAAQPSTQMGRHSQCATATGNSASENPPRLSEMPAASTVIYCQSTPLPITCLRRQNPGNVSYKKQLAPSEGSSASGLSQGRTGC